MGWSSIVSYDSLGNTKPTDDIVADESATAASVALEGYRLNPFGRVLIMTRVYMCPLEGELIGLMRTKVQVWNGQAVDRLESSIVGAWIRLTVNW